MYTVPGNKDGVPCSIPGVQGGFMKGGLLSWIFKDEKFSRKQKNRLPGRGLGTAGSGCLGGARRGQGTGVSTWLKLDVSREGVAAGGPEDAARAALFPAHATSQHKPSPLGPTQVFLTRTNTWGHQYRLWDCMYLSPTCGEG